MGFGLITSMAEALNYICPFCGHEVRVGKPCPGCAKKPPRRKSRPGKIKAASRKKSWETEASEDGLNLPDEDFDYDEFVAREFGKSPHRQLGVKWYWWLLGVIALLAIIGWTL